MLALAARYERLANRIVAGINVFGAAKAEEKKSSRREL
jgi:hypothetical protein